LSLHSLLAGNACAPSESEGSSPLESSQTPGSEQRQCNLMLLTEMSTPTENGLVSRTISKQYEQNQCEIDEHLMHAWSSHIQNNIRLGWEAIP
jgi:hypothetical protein